MSSLYQVFVCCTEKQNLDETIYVNHINQNNQELHFYNNSRKNSGFHVSFDGLENEDLSQFCLLGVTNSCPYVSLSGTAWRSRTIVAIIGVVQN